MPNTRARAQVGNVAPVADLRRQRTGDRRAKRLTACDRARVKLTHKSGLLYAPAGRLQSSQCAQLADLRRKRAPQRRVLNATVHTRAHTAQSARALRDYQTGIAQHAQSSETRQHANGRRQRAAQGVIHKANVPKCCDNRTLKPGQPARAHGQCTTQTQPQQQPAAAEYTRTNRSRIRRHCTEPGRCSCCRQQNAHTRRRSL